MIWERAHFDMWQLFIKQSKGQIWSNIAYSGQSWSKTSQTRGF